ncbi:serine/threonine-protein kinase [Nocardia callitridis]|uniref:non-specific serine/threonine protein kinase n=1 Tax=Nocardia callitridis TaxID=648753 RepID=A0ABP9JUD8_9NOCA
MLRSGDVFAGYAIKRVLGQGGMGTVYLARHPRLPRLTALKLLNRELYSDAEARRRFEREADLVAQLDHPNIVTVYDRGVEDRQLWICMQHVAGSDAASADVHVLAPDRAVQIAAETAAALDFAHRNRVLHRDVKPANILLAKAPIGQHERVLLTDFGIASMRDSESTLASAGTISATMAFAAPEQLSGRPLDERADQYSLACTLFWLLTGSGPFPGATPVAVLNGHLHAPVPLVSRLRPGLPPALDQVLTRAMAKHPADRFGSCTEFANAAAQALIAPPRTGGMRPVTAPFPLTPPVPEHTPRQPVQEQSRPRQDRSPSHRPPPHQPAPGQPARNEPAHDQPVRTPPPQPTSVPPPPTFTPPRRPVRPRTIELPDLPRRPGG